MRANKPLIALAAFMVAMVLLVLCESMAGAIQPAHPPACTTGDYPDCGDDM